MIVEQTSLRAVLDAQAKQKLLDFYNAVAPHRAEFRKRNLYYSEQLAKYLKHIIPPGRKVLEIGCGDGWLLQQLEPSQGLGIDLSPAMIDRANAVNTNPNIHFRVGDIESINFNDTYDFIVMSDLLGFLIDIQAAMENVRSACNDSTRVVINFHGIFWEPLLNRAAGWGMKMPQPRQVSWLARSDIEHFATLSDFEIVSFERRMLMPKWIPGFSWLVNRYLPPLPPFRWACLCNLLVLRCRPRLPSKTASVTVLIPCRNEKGNIRAAIERLPDFGTAQEIIFVDGHSTDGTVEEIEQVMRDFPHKDIKLLHQHGKGKGDAVRLGFAHAANDILMILDADLTVPPEDLPKFYEAIVSGKGEFINGSRLVYPMESQAMRMLNILGNKFFSMALSWLLNQRLKDTLCGTKVLRKSHYEQIVAGRKFFGDFDPFGDFDLIFGAAKLNLKIVEVPIRYRDRTYGSTNISRFRHGWLLLKMTLFAFRKLKLLG